LEELVRSHYRPENFSLSSSIRVLGVAEWLERLAEVAWHCDSDSVIKGVALLKDQVLRI